jgi:hypothetical protein
MASYSQKTHIKDAIIPGNDIPAPEKTLLNV